MTTGEAVRRSIDGLLHHLMVTGPAVDRTQVVTSAVRAGRSGTMRVTWQGVVSQILHMSGQSLDEYLFCVEHRQYSALLYDGAFLQVSYDLTGSELAGHRLVFWPSPFAKLDLRDFATDGAWDVVETYADEVRSNPNLMKLAGPWRFDFDPKAATERHAASHLTAMHSECRIPGSRPLDLRRFCVLVFRHLWHPSDYNCHHWADETPSIAESEAANVHRPYLHLAWR